MDVSDAEEKGRLVDSPPVRNRTVIGSEEIYIAADYVPRLLEFEPIGLEGVDDRLVNDMRAKGLHTNNLALLPEGKGWLLVEFGGETREEADAKERRMIDAVTKGTHGTPAKLFATQADQT